MLKNIFPFLPFLFFCYSHSFAQEQSQNQENEQFYKTVTYHSGEVNEIYIPPPSITPYSERTAAFDITYVDVPANVQAVVEFAASIWHTALNATQPITLKVIWEPLPCSGGLCVLGSTSTNMETEGGVGYPTALINQIDDTDYSWFYPDITFTLNSEYPNFYVELDENCPDDQKDLVSVTLHEIGHGLGFASGVWYAVEVFNNSYYNSFVQIGNAPGGTAMDAVDWSTSVESDNLFWNGAHATAANGGNMPAIFAPNPYQPGSSLSHFDDQSPSITANVLMRPGISDGEKIHSPSVVDMGLLEDLGWSINCIFDGCTDPDACNYDSDACNDDGSCIEPEWYLPITVGNGQALFACSNISGYVLASNQSCAESVISGDAYCEYNNWDLICEAAYNCCEDTDNHGCTIEGSCNYDADACWFDGSCFSCITGYSCFNLTVSGGGAIFPADGVWELIGSDGDVEATGDYYFSVFSVGYLEIDLCVPEDCYTFQMIPEPLSAGVSWDIGFEGVLFSGNINDTASLSSTGAGGCMNIIACNYDEFACFDDGSCDYYSPSVFLEGIEDYTWLLQTNIFCEGQYSSGSWVELLADNTYITEGGNEGTWSACDSNFSLLSDGGSLYTGSVSLFTDHFIAGTYNSNPGGSFALMGCFKMTSITLGCTDSLACNYSESATYDDGNCTYPGCEDPLACNYLPFPGCLETCIYPAGQIHGCTYASATNYDVSANTDDGTCIFDLVDSGMCGTGTYFDAVTSTCLPDGTATGDGCPGDLDNDGFISTNDLLAFLAVFGAACP